MAYSRIRHAEQIRSQISKIEKEIRAGWMSENEIKLARADIQALRNKLAEVSK